MSLEKKTYMTQKEIKVLTAMRSPNWLVNFVPMQLLTNPSTVAPAI